ncbi:flavin-binding monooxygenase-like-domain-containing protein [Flagelloscypha sp. PMI_526]|nr:flavin-binding monooxygenase-like-domain-containing protein [Flagelloscypha sp. PMI_526]
MESRNQPIPSSVDCLVIGAGAAGLTAVKNLHEVGLTNTIVLDERDSFGGVWRFTSDPNLTSVLLTTRANISKQKSSYTDLPYPDTTPDFPSWKQVLDYLESYVDQFDLRSSLYFGIKVLDVARHEEAGRDAWVVKWKSVGQGAGEGMLEVKRLVIANGAYSAPKFPDIPGRELFHGIQVHAQAYKGPKPFSDLKVVIVGLAFSGSDIAVDLVGHASNIYASHRGGILIAPRRTMSGTPFDQTTTLRRFSIMSTIEYFFPNFRDYLFRPSFLQKMQVKLQPLDPQWHLSPPKSPLRSGITISDDIVEKMRFGQVVPIGEIVRFTGPKSLEVRSREHHSQTLSLEDVDAVIFATGYHQPHNFMSSYHPSRSSPRASSPELKLKLKLGTNGDDARIPNSDLYWNIFDATYPTSLAYVGHLSRETAGCGFFDLVSMAIAQVFSSNYKLPPSGAILRETEQKNSWFEARLQRGPFFIGSVPNAGLFAFLDKVSGARVGENVKWWWHW